MGLSDCVTLFTLFRAGIKAVHWQESGYMIPFTIQGLCLQYTAIYCQSGGSLTHQRTGVGINIEVGKLLNTRLIRDIGLGCHNIRVVKCSTATIVFQRHAAMNNNHLLPFSQVSYN